jgi:hypothetical protein
MFGVSAKTPKGEVVLRELRLRKGSFRAASASLRKSGRVDLELGAGCASTTDPADAVDVVRFCCAVRPCVVEGRGVRTAGISRALEMDGHKSVVADAMDCAS